MIYAYSMYLDKMSKHWDALVMNDYEVVMPLTWNRKFGIYYLYQPFFTASLGIIGNNLNPVIIQAFLETVPEKFKFWDIYLNRENIFTVGMFSHYTRHNYILDLCQTYENIASGFSSNHLRNISRARQLGCTAEKNIPIENIVALAKDQSRRFSPITTKDYQHFISLFNDLHAQQQGLTYGVYSNKNKLVASCAFVFSHKRAYYILVGNHPDGRRLGASHFLIAQFIRDHAGQSIILDFEGSDIPSLALFYKGFGAQEEKYAALKLNKLPFIAKLFKK